MSAERGNLNFTENEKRTENLHNDLNKLNHKVVKAHGVFIENYGKKDARPVKENTFIVMHKKEGDDGGELLGHLKSLGRKYEQDSILHKGYNTNEAFFHGTNKTGYPGEGNTDSVGTLRMNETGEFHTRLQDGRTFRFRKD